MTQTMLIKGRSLLLALIAAALLVALNPGPAVAQEGSPSTKVTESVTYGDLFRGAGVDPYTGETSAGRAKQALEGMEAAPPPGPASPPGPAPKAEAKVLPASGGVSASGLSLLTLGGATVLIVGSGLLVRGITRNLRS
jgi:hypothetical protein